MKLSIKPAVLKYLALGAGVLGLVLRTLLYALATDEEGLLTRNHPLGILLFILTIVTVAALFLLTRSITGPEEYSDCFQPSVPGGISCILGAAGILITSISEFSSTELLISLLGFAAAAALAVAGFFRFSDRKPSFLLYVLLCLYFAVRMVSQYRYWSSDPQLQDYCCCLCACVGLMLTAYHHGAFGADMGSHKQLWFFSLASVYLCCLSLAGPENRLFYLGAGIWAFCNLSCLAPQPRRQRPSLSLEEDPGPQEV